MITNIDIDSYAEKIYKHNLAVGWWGEEPMERCLYTCMQLIPTEVAEATEGVRKGLMDDHLPARKMEEVELADALIRTLDMGGYWRSKSPSFSYREKVLPDGFCDKSYPVGRQLLGINGAIIDLAREYLITDWVSEAYSRLVNSILLVADNRGFDIESAMVEKMAYNTHRADHKRENREKENGKKF